MAYDCPRPSRRAVMAATRVMTGWRVEPFLLAGFSRNKNPDWSPYGMCHADERPGVCRFARAGARPRVSEQEDLWAGRVRLWSPRTSGGARLAHERALEASPESARSRLRASTRARDANGRSAGAMPLVPSSDPPDEADPVRCATFPPSRAQQRRSRRRVSLPPAAPSTRVPRRARASIRPRGSPAYPRAPPLVR